MTFNIQDTKGNEIISNFVIDYDNMNGVEIVKYIRSYLVIPNTHAVVYVDGNEEAIITKNGIYS